MLDYKLNGYHGIILPGLDVGLDISNPSARHVFISHAHADHLPRNRKMHVYATAATARLMRVRGFQGEITTLEFEKPLQLDRCSVTFYPAGHILGSAMTEIISDDGSILYTGDYRTPPSPVTEGFSSPPRTDYFITEATFPLPIYRWKPHEVLFASICDFAEDSLSRGLTPVFLCYNLGKAQEVMHALKPLNRMIKIHKAGYQLCKVYEEFGFDLGRYVPHGNGSENEGEILVAPSSFLDKPLIAGIKKKKIAYVSGWAALESRQAQMTIDKLIPLSDHIDFFSLIDLCQKLSPKMVYITHTPNPAVVGHYLYKMGVKSQPLNLESFDDNG